MKPVFISRRLARCAPHISGRRPSRCGSSDRRVQRGLEPDDWKPIRSIGPGVREIRIRDAAGAFRVIYVATFVDAVYVLHAFQKKSQATPKRDLDLAAARLRDLMRRVQR